MPNFSYTGAVFRDKLNVCGLGLELSGLYYITVNYITEAS